MLAFALRVLLFFILSLSLTLSRSFSVSLGKLNRSCQSLDYSKLPKILLELSNVHRSLYYVIESLFWEEEKLTSKKRSSETSLDAQIAQIV